LAVNLQDGTGKQSSVFIVALTLPDRHTLAAICTVGLTLHGASKKS